jgi:hypothetical protein
VVIYFTANMVDMLVAVIDGRRRRVVGSVVVHSPVGVGQQAQPRRGDGDGDGPSGTAMAVARGGTRQWRREGGGDGD